MNSTALDQLKAQVQDNFKKTMDNNSELGKFLNDYGLTDKTIQFQVILNAEKLRSSSNVRDSKIYELLQVSEVQKDDVIIIESCCWDGTGSVPC